VSPAVAVETVDTGKLMAAAAAAAAAAVHRTELIAFDSVADWWSKIDAVAVAVAVAAAPAAAAPGCHKIKSVSFAKTHTHNLQMVKIRSSDSWNSLSDSSRTPGH